MDPNNVQASLDKLKQILAGRTTTDLISNLDRQLLPQNNPIFISSTVASTYNVKF